MELLYPVFTVVVAALPLAATALLAWRATGWRRSAAALLTAPVAGVLVFEGYSAWVGGNLTGLIWFFSTPVVVGALLVLVVAEWMSGQWSRSGSGGPST